jgi:hypothetical protein
MADERRKEMGFKHWFLPERYGRAAGRRNLEALGFGKGSRGFGLDASRGSHLSYQ